jgi:two-component system cell cycle sensor histidine kinase/response regulator CckA
MCSSKRPRNEWESGQSLASKTISRRDKAPTQRRHIQAIDALALMAGGMCHDFNTLLTAILGYGELLLINPSLGDSERRKVEAIVASAVQARSITQQILTLSRRHSHAETVVNLSGLITDLETFLRRLAGSKTDLMTDLRWDVGGVKADATQLTQVIMNLVANARDAMPHGGKLTLRTSAMELEPTSTEFPNASAGQYVVLGVSDSGCGMDERTKARIFEPFFTTKPEGKGTGLGLAMVYEIVARMGGHIHVLSRPSEGTTFELLLPRIQSPTSNVMAQKHDCRRLTGVETILVVDDYDVARNLTIEFLSSFGYTVLAARNGKEAIRLAKKHAQPIHLLLTDIVMPKMSGPVLAKQFGVIHPETKIIYMTAYADSIDAQNAGMGTPQGVLSKPYMHHELLGKVRGALGSPMTH